MRLFALPVLLASEVPGQSGTEAKAGGPPARLLDAATTVLETNRVYWVLSNRGNFYGGQTGQNWWPRGSSNDHMYSTGLQFAGVIRGTKPGNPWGGDTTGAMLYDATGPRRHGTPLTTVFRASDPADLANWPDLALVPSGDAVGALFDPALQGRKSASDGDAYWITWDGDPSLNPASRAHPLGLLVEHRILAWNYPSGNADVVYIMATYYNVTSLRAADYAQHRPAMRSLLLQKAQDFHALNNARFGITLPDAGYAIDDLHAGWGADPDIGNAASNYASVSLPFALGFAWQRDFTRLARWQYDPALFGAPFFAGVGFVGTAFLRTATGPGEILVYGNRCNAVGVCQPDPTSSGSLWRQLSGRGSALSGDVPCRTSDDPRTTRICYVRNEGASDIRQYQSSPGHTLLPGGSATVVVALVHAAPVAIPGFTPTAATDVKPGNPLLIASVDSMAKYGGVNLIDSIAGFRGFTDNGDGMPEPREFDLVPRSLLAKTRLARQIFENRFLLPSAPAAPSFSLATADGRVTVTWQPSPTEQQGDPFFATASTPTRTGAGGSEPNGLYDPNFRRLDVEGYRLYRGQSDNPAALELLAQWDYAGTRISDHGGHVVQGGGLAPTPDCAPELGRGAPPQCRVAFAPITPGVTSTAAADYDLSGPLVQVDYGGRELLPGGGVVLLLGQADTALTSRGFPALRDSGVPFTYLDQDVRAGVRYFYTVTAFDINSIRSGPSSMESAKVLQSVTVAGTTGPGSGDGLARVHPVPDPYYPSTGATKEVTFVDVPAGARIRLYSMQATLIRVLQAPAGSGTSSVPWDLRDRSGKDVASGVYFYHVESAGRTRVGRMTIVQQR